MLITLSTKQAATSAILLPRTEDVFVEYPVCVISVAVLVTVV